MHFIFAQDIQGPTHIIAVGADEEGKQELDPYLFLHATHIYGDALPQTTKFGDTSYALQKDLIQPQQLVELGHALMQSPSSTSLTDLTGLAAQDIFIAQWVYEKLEKQK